MKLYVYPQLNKEKVKNPYVQNMGSSLTKYFDVLQKEFRIHLPQTFRLLYHAFKADIFILNWIESPTSGPFKSTRGLIGMLALWVIYLKHKKTIWIFHNIHPHEGESFWSQKIKRFLFRHATAIVAHSQEATDYVKQYSERPVYFKNHPFEIKKYAEYNGVLQDCDLFLWGNIYPYKGIVEFLNNPLCKESKRKILIVGRCLDNFLDEEIKKYCGDFIVYENRSASFEEIAAYCRKAKYVLFPYVGDSVSSSGALMDTLQMGGIPVGPKRGAFDDLAQNGCCIVYNSIEEVFGLPFDNKNRIEFDSDQVNAFLRDNSWQAFAHWIYDLFSDNTNS